MIAVAGECRKQKGTGKLHHGIGKGENAYGF